MNWNILGLLVLFLGAATHAIRAEAAPPRVELDLVDGSHLLGTPGMTSVSVQTPYARMEIPLTQLRCVLFSANHESVDISLRNGDRLTGVITLAPFKLQTIFGVVSIGVEHLRELRAASTNLLTDDSLLGFWPLDGDAKDGKGQNHGKVEGASFATGLHDAGQGVAIRGVTSYVNLGSARDVYHFAYNHSFTVSLWARINTVQAGHTGFFFEAFGAPPGSCGDNPFVADMSYNEKGVGFEVAQACVGANALTTALDLKVWHHYVGVFDTRELHFYVDGVSQGDTAYTFGAIPDPASNFVLGTMRDQGAWVYTDAVIDNAAIWSRALSEADVRELYRTTK